MRKTFRLKNISWMLLSGTFLLEGTLPAQGAISPESYIALSDTPHPRSQASQKSPQTLSRKETLILGAALASNNGVLHNLRFNTLVKPGFEGNVRMFTKDEPMGSLGQVIKVLFPSSAGILAPVTNGDYNFGRQATPQKIRYLYDYVDLLRDHSALQEQKTEALEASAQQAFNNWQGGKTDEKTEKKFFKFLEHLEAVICEEKSSTFPPYFLEIVLGAFVQQRFDTSEDLLRILGEKISFTKHSLEDYIKNITAQSAYSTLDLFLFSDYSIGSVLPYTTEIPVSNSSIYPYKRLTGTIINTTDTFPDCTETALRHLCTLFLYNPKTKQYDLSRLSEDIQQKTPFFEPLRNYFENTSPSLANDGSSFTRENWNKVVGDLPDLTVYRVAPEGGGSHNIAASLTNWIAVLQKILGLSLESSAGNTLEGQKKWAKASFQKIFQALNPELSCDIKFINADFQDEKLTGDIEVLVSENGANKEQIFSFQISTTGRHSKLFGLKDLHKMRCEENNKYYAEKFKKNLDSLEGTTAKAILSLLCDEQDSRNAGRFLALLKEPLQENDARIEFLSMLRNDFTSLSKKQKAILGHTLGSVLQDVSWEDPSVIERQKLWESLQYLGEINSLKKKFNTIKTLCGPYSVLKNYLSVFKNLRNLDIEGDDSCEVVDLVSQKNLKKVTFREGLSKKASFIFPSSIETLETEIIFPEALRSNSLPQLKKIALHGCSIAKGIMDLSSFPTVTSIEIIPGQSQNNFYKLLIASYDSTIDSGLPSIKLPPNTKEVSMPKILVNYLTLQGRSSLEILKSYFSVCDLTIVNDGNSGSVDLNNVDHLRSLNILGPHQSVTLPQNLETLCSIKAEEVQNWVLPKGFKIEEIASGEWRVKKDSQERSENSKGEDL